MICLMEEFDMTQDLTIELKQFLTLSTSKEKYERKLWDVVESRLHLLLHQLPETRCSNQTL